MPTNAPGTPGVTASGVRFVYTAACDLRIGDTLFSSASVGLHIIECIEIRLLPLDEGVLADVTVYCDDDWSKRFVLTERMVARGDMHNWVGKRVESAALSPLSEE